MNSGFWFWGFGLVFGLGFRARFWARVLSSWFMGVVFRLAAAIVILNISLFLSFGIWTPLAVVSIYFLYVCNLTRLGCPGWTFWVFGCP